jgi:ribose 5-phosphate isomerase A
MSSERMIVIADASKRVAPLGKFPLPVEVVRFGLVATRNMVAAHAAEAGCEGAIELRLGKDGTPVVTDGGNFLLDCAFGRIDKPEMLDDALKRVPGVVENGLFLGIADIAIVAGAGGVVLLERDGSRKSN